MNKIPLKFYKLLNIFLLILPLYSLSQETGTLRGRVTDSEHNRLELVNIKISHSTLPNPLGTVTDEKGNYQIKVPANIELEVTFSFMGFQSKTVKTFTKVNEIKRLDCQLLPSVETLPDYEIIGQKEKGSGNTHIDFKEIEDIAGVKGGVENIIKSLPGVMSNDDMTSQYSVRGGNFDENLVYINGIEVYRPFLIRSSQQEGLSIINPDMVSSIMFSSGGFESKYGDKMSSVLDISYKKPQQFYGTVAVSLLGASLYVEDFIKNKFSYNIGVRQHSNTNLLKTLDQKGDYKTSSTDIQGFFNYKVNEKLNFSFLGIFSNNVYRVVPQDRETDFGNMYEAMRLKIYFDGEEKDRFQTLLGAFTSTYMPNKNTQLQLTVSGFNSKEHENYDIFGQFWLHKLEQGEEEEIRGIGTYLDHGRNNLYANVISVEHKGLVIAPSGNWNWGIKYQHDYVYNNLNEWKLIDSAGYTIPSSESFPGEAGSSHPPMLQNVIKNKNEVVSNRISGFIQKNWTFHNRLEDEFILLAGIRGQYWDFNKEFLLSPRVSFSYLPHWGKNLVFRLATGVYSQSPFYREYRNPQGEINRKIKSQKSYQIVGAFDYQFQAWERPFKLTTEIYYKYITDLIPYTIDNLRIQYAGHNDAKGYATGIDVRINGEFVPDIESWASMTLMKTQEDIFGDNFGYIDRPTDQLFMFKLFFQDYIPSIPWWKMNILFTFGSGLPVTKPNQTDFSKTTRFPTYMRVDWGTSLRIKDPSSKWAQNNVFRHIKNIWIYFDLFNLFDNKNVISYLWVSDYENRQYAVPNYLTRRQINLKLSLDF